MEKYTQYMVCWQDKVGNEFKKLFRVQQGNEASNDKEKILYYISDAYADALNVSITNIDSIDDIIIPSNDDIIDVNMDKMKNDALFFENCVIGWTMFFWLMAIAGYFLNNRILRTIGFLFTIGVLPLIINMIEKKYFPSNK